MAGQAGRSAGMVAVCRGCEGVVAIEKGLIVLLKHGGSCNGTGKRVRVRKSTPIPEAGFGRLGVATRTHRLHCCTL